MKLHEFQELVKKERDALRLTNLEKIVKIVNATNTPKKGKN
jgi:hypothetical protein